jgi:hypothetical protein
MSAPSGSKLSAEKRNKKSSDVARSSNDQPARTDSPSQILDLQGSAGNQAVTKLIEQGVPPEIAKIAPSLPYKRREVVETHEVSSWHALRARWERFKGNFVEPWEVTPGQKTIRRVVDEFHRFPGVWTVHGKSFQGDWLVRTRNGIIEAWQLKPELDAYIEAANGDEEIARRHHDAAKMRESYFIRYWEEGWPLDDAMGLMRREVEIDFKSAVWGAAQGVQGAAGQAGLKPGLGLVGGLSKLIDPPPKVPGKGARLRGEPTVPATMRARSNEKPASRAAYRPPHRDTGNRKPPPSAVEKRLRATGTDTNQAKEALPNYATNKQKATTGIINGAEAQGVPPIVATRSRELADPRSFDPEFPPPQPSEKVIAPRVNDPPLQGADVSTATEKTAEKHLAGLKDEDALERTAGPKSKDVKEWSESSMVGKLDEPAEIQAVVQHMKDMEFVYTKDQFGDIANTPKWLRQAFPKVGGEVSGPEVVAITRAQKKILLVDIVARPNVDHIDKGASRYIDALIERLPDHFKGWEISYAEWYYVSPKPLEEVSWPVRRVVPFRSTKVDKP